MAMRLAFLIVLLSVLGLLSGPIFEGVSWKGKVPVSVRDRITLVEANAAATDTFGGTQQYHAIRLPANRMLRIDLISEDFDPVLALYRATTDTLELLGQDDDSGEGNNSHLERCIEHEGIYVMRVTAYGSRRSGRYTLRPATENRDCAAMAAEERQREQEAQRQRELEAQRQRDQAVALYHGRPIHLGDVVNSYLGSGSPRTPDGKAFEAWDLSCDAGTTFNMAITGSGYDAYAMVVDSLGNRVASDDDSGGNLNPSLTYTCTTSGTYHLISSTFSTSGSGGPYTLRLSRR
jgi:hypothetical protein